MKLSFILPIFNTGKYLQKCIDSTLAQNLPAEDFEVLLVYDEGSTDNSLEIAQANAENHPNVRLIQHSNRSIGESLNYAFPLAKGEYVQVIDTDDYLEPNTIAPLLQRIYVEQLDIMRFKYQNIDEDYQIIQYNKHPYQGMDFSASVTDGLDFLVHRMGYACYVPTMIFRRELLLHDGNEMLAIAINDSEWLPRIVAQASRVASTETIVYNYLIRNTSKMNSGRDMFIVEETLKVFDAYRPYLQSSANKWYKEAMTRGVVAILSRISSQSMKTIREYVYKIKQYPIFPLPISQQTQMGKIRIRMINISPMLYCLLMRIRLYIRK
jgi:glycosyltransferase involved in cell wall biosynthesis